MRIRVTRKGGLAGIPVRGEIDTSELPTDQARLAEDALNTLPEAAAGGLPRHPDGFQYELAYTLDNGASRATLMDEADVPDGLRPVITTAMGRGTLG